MAGADDELTGDDAADALLAFFEALLGPLPPTPVHVQLERAEVGRRLEANDVADPWPAKPDREELQRFLDRIGETEYVDLDDAYDYGWAVSRWCSESPEWQARRRRAKRRYPVVVREVRAEMEAQRANLGAVLLAEAKRAAQRVRPTAPPTRPRGHRPRTPRATRAGPARPADDDEPPEDLAGFLRYLARRQGGR